MEKDDIRGSIFSIRQNGPTLSLSDSHAFIKVVTLPPLLSFKLCTFTNIISIKLIRPSETVTATEEIESPALGFIRQLHFKTGSITLNTAIIKQNNTLIYLVTKQAERLSELGGEVEKLKRAIEVLGKREVKPVDLEDSIESLTKRLDNLAISGKPSASNKKGQIHVFKDPHKIFKEEYEKQKKK
ncbi:hypothetical protein R6Q59_000189 [Mikania micrantha]